MLSSDEFGPTTKLKAHHAQRLTELALHGFTGKKKIVPGTRGFGVDFTVRLGGGGSAAAPASEHAVPSTPEKPRRRIFATSIM